MRFSLFYKKKEFEIFLIIFLPYIIFLNPTNINQFDLKIIGELAIIPTLIYVFFVTGIICFSNHKILLKLLNILAIVYLINSQFYIINDINLIFLQNFKYKLFLFFFILTFTIYLFLNYENNFLKFIKILFLLNLILILINYSIKSFESNEGQFVDRSISYKTEKKSYDNFYLIVLDGMMSFDNAKELGLINNEHLYEEYRNTGKKINTNYNYTYLSMASILELYPASFVYKSNIENRNNFYPFNLYSHRKPFLLDILKEKSIKFNWYGNNRFECRENFQVNCNKINQKFSEKYHIKTFLKNNIFYYLWRYVNDSEESQATLIKNRNNLDQLMTQILQSNDLKKNNFYFVHYFYPHDPFVLDENCNTVKEISDELIGYQNAYNCVLHKLTQFTSTIDKNDPNSTVLVLSDHGWNLFENNDLNKLDNHIYIFNYSYSKNCSLKLDNMSYLNFFREHLACHYDIEFKYNHDNEYYDAISGKKILLNKVN